MKLSYFLIISLCVVFFEMSNLHAYTPYYQPVTDEQKIDCVQIGCPICGYVRYFPDIVFFIDRYSHLTNEEDKQMRDAVYDYNNELIPGNMCLFCGGMVPLVYDLL